MKRFIRSVKSRRGSAMVEAAISMPVLIIAAMLMIRLFTFYLEILTAGIAIHKEAMERQDAYGGAAIRTHCDERNISMLKGGLLGIDVHKRIEVRAYMINEDLLVRSGELAE